VLIQHSSNVDTYFYLSAVWLIVDLENGPQKRQVFKKIGLHAQHMLTILGIIINMVEGGAVYMTT
jgi:hypothetical protein